MIYYLQHQGPQLATTELIIKKEFELHYDEQFHPDKKLTADYMYNIVNPTTNSNTTDARLVCDLNNR
jgi:hypothetical protein